MRHNTHHNYPPPTQQWQFTQSLRGQGEIIHRFPSRDVLLNIGNIQDPGFHHPYILDWYYFLQPFHSMNTSIASTPLHDKILAFEATNDQLWTNATNDYLPAHSQLQEGTIEEDWRFCTLPERLHSNFEASTSSALLRDDSPHNRDAELHNMNHWWARSGPHSSGPQASFLEPPVFERHNSSYHSDNISERSWGGQEASDGRARDWRNLGGMMSRTMYMDDSDQDDGFGLHFTGDSRKDEGSAQAASDVFGGPLVSFPVKILPRSKDPV